MDVSVRLTEGQPVLEVCELQRTWQPIRPTGEGADQPGAGEKEAAQLRADVSAT